MHLRLSHPSSSSPASPDRFLPRLATSIAGLVLAATTAGAAAATEEDAQAFQAAVAWLASDELEGRGLGSAGIADAEEYIAERLGASGLEPMGDRGTAFQTFDMVTEIASAEAGNRLELQGEGGAVAAALGTDYLPFSESGSGTFEGPVLFAGYALHAPEQGYDDLAEVDPRGRVVVALRYEPRENDADSHLNGSRPIAESALLHKAEQLAMRGAAALILVDGPLAKASDALPRLEPRQTSAGLPVIAMTRRAAAEWLAPAGLDLEAEQRRIDQTMEPGSRPLEGLSARGEVRLDASMTRCRNVVFGLPGAGALASEWVLLSAHHDHLGWGGPRSMAPGTRAVHNGADDNASGVAALLGAAARLVPRLRALDSRRGLLAVSFSAEEAGLIGSRHYVAHPTRPLAATAAVINMDMVGRLRPDQGLTLLGTGSAALWEEWLDAESRRLELPLRLAGDAYGPSDQSSFLARGIPALQLFTGAHAQYHSPQDDVELINAAGGARIAELAAGLVLRVATAPRRPELIAQATSAEPRGDARSLGASLGTIPDYASMGQTEGGVLLSGVREGSPAAAAGLRAGDRIVELEGSPVANIRDYTYELRRRAPGTHVPLVVLREGERHTLAVTLGSRARGAGHSAHSRPKAAHPHARPEQPHVPSPVHDARELHLRNIRQLTFGGENAEAYFSPDGSELIYQATSREQKKAGGCDRIYIYDLETGRSRQISSGRGRTTCGYFDWPEGERVIYASTRGGGDACPPVPDHSSGYVWPLYESFDLYLRPADGSGPPRPIAAAPGYDAEATWCHRGGRIVFTSTRDGDIELYSMDEEGSDLRRLTFEPGYDGGAFFNADCSKIVFRASRPRGAALADYRGLLEAGLVRPGELEIYVMDAAGGEAIALTDDGAANFGPYFHPGGRRVIYSSNRGSEGGREFDLYMVGIEGGEPERITYARDFDGFPMFSPDGRHLVWGSNRHNEQRGETNLFIAEWLDDPAGGA